MGCISLLLPILGLYGYYFEIDWLFYSAGGIATILDIVALFNGQLRCLGSVVTIVFWFYGYRLTDSFWNGLIFGSCASSILLLVVFFVILTVSAGISAAIGGMFRAFSWFEDMF